MNTRSSTVIWDDILILISGQCHPYQNRTVLLLVNLLIDDHVDDSEMEFV